MIGWLARKPDGQLDTDAYGNVIVYPDAERALHESWHYDTFGSVEWGHGDVAFVNAGTETVGPGC